MIPNRFSRNWEFDNHMMKMRVKYRNSYQWCGNCCIHTRKATDLIFKNQYISAKVTLEKHFVILSQNPMVNSLILFLAIVMQVTKLCWWRISDVEDRINLLVTIFIMLDQHLIYCTNILYITKLSRTHYISNIRHQHWWSYIYKILISMSGWGRYGSKGRSNWKNSELELKEITVCIKWKKLCIAWNIYKKRFGGEKLVAPKNCLETLRSKSPF